MSNRRIRRDSIEGQKIEAKQSKMQLAVPDGVELETEKERTLWRQYTSARAPDDWRDLDLLLLVKMIKIETDIDKWKPLLDEVGPIVIDDKGNQKVNPLITIIDKWQQQQMKIFRSLSLGTGSDHASHANKRGRRAVTIENEAPPDPAKSKTLGLISI